MHVVISVLRAWLLVAALWVPLAGCIEPFDGSRLTFNLVGSRSPCQTLKLLELNPPATWKSKCSDKIDAMEAELANRVIHHYEIWAVLDRSAVVQLGHFTVQRHLFTDEQIQFEANGVVLPGGEPFHIVEDKPFLSLGKTQQDETRQQMNKAQKAYAITGYSPRKLKGKTLDDDIYVGSHTQLTRPHNGTYYGQVLGKHPFGTGLLGGGYMNVAPSLDNLDSIFITIEDADPHRARPRPSGPIYLEGTAVRVARGVINVNATCPHIGGVTREGSKIKGSFAVQTNLDLEEYF